MTEKLSLRRVAQIISATLSIAVLLAIVVMVSKTNAQDSYTGQWIIDTGRTTNQFHATFSYRSGKQGRGNSMSGFMIDPQRLQGLTREQIASTGSHVVFQLVRDAGTLNCEGWFKDGKGSGHFTFTPNPGFAAELQKRGYESPTEAQQFAMTINSFSLEYVREVRALGYTVDKVELITRMVDHGVSVSFIKDMEAAGFKQMPVETL